MKKLILFLVLSTITAVTIFGQHFEGKIFYSISFKNRDPYMSDEQWKVIFGTKQEYLIKGGNYKIISDGRMYQWKLYINKENKIYNKSHRNNKALWFDGTFQGDEVLKVEVNKDVTEILGYKCDEVILTCTSVIKKYYFNSKFSVDTKLFLNHKFGNWIDYLTHSNALPLKSIIDDVRFTLISEAVEIKPMKLDDKEFQLPEGITIEEGGKVR